MRNLISIIIFLSVGFMSSPAICRPCDNCSDRSGFSQTKGEVGSMVFVGCGPTVDFSNFPCPIEEVTCSSSAPSIVSCVLLTDAQTCGGVVIDNKTWFAIANSPGIAEITVCRFSPDDCRPCFFAAFEFTVTADPKLEPTPTPPPTPTPTPTPDDSPVTLEVSLAGNGSGVITSSPAGINCGFGSDCNEEYDFGTVVTLTAKRDLDSSFDGWSGCSPDANDPLQCVVVMDADKKVTVSFNLSGPPKVISSAEIIQLNPTKVKVTFTRSMDVDTLLANLPQISDNLGGLDQLVKIEGFNPDATAVTYKIISFLDPGQYIINFNSNVKDTSGEALEDKDLLGWDMAEFVVKDDQPPTPTPTPTPDDIPGSIFIVAGQGNLTGCKPAFGIFPVVPAVFLRAGGGKPQSGYTWTLAAGSTFPIGTTVDPLTGIFHGTGGSLAPGSGTHTFDMTVSDGSTTATGIFTFTVRIPIDCDPGRLQQSSSETIVLPNAKAGDNYGASLFVEVGDATLPLTWSLDTSGPGNLPSGLEIDFARGVVRGSPFSSEGGKTFSFKIVVKDSNGEIASCPNDGICPTYEITVGSSAVTTRELLEVRSSGSGSGFISSAPAGIACGFGSGCNEEYDLGTVVTLTANPDDGSTFDGWSGCTADDTFPLMCDVVMDADKKVTVTFNLSSSPPTTGKSFTFNCEHSMKRGFFFGLETLTMNVGDTENCTLKLTNHKRGQTKEVSTQILNWFWSGIKIEPARSVTDENGELKITITAIKKGRDWAAWAVPNDKNVFEFNKKTYDGGLAWGMFVEVR